MDIGTTFKNALIFNDNELSENLISIPRLDDEGCTITITNGKMIVTKDNKIILEGQKEEGLYQFDLDGTETALLGNVIPRDRTAKLQRLHHALGHRNLLRINKYIRERKIRIKDFPSNVTDIEIRALPLCDACLRAKFTKRRLPRVERKVPSEIGAYVSTDMKGPIRIKGTRGERYYQGFLDDHSKFLTFKCFVYKSDALSNLESILSEPPFHNNVLRYHADGAGELISKEIVSLLRKTGVVVSYSSPYTSTDNPAIERSHRTVFESAHAMLLHACLPTTYWCYAVAHAVYIYNRIPTNTAKGYVAPITAAFGAEVDLSSEHTFGCNCYGIIPGEIREKGFSDKGYKAIYFGHRPNGSPGYLLLFIEANKVIECSHVVFDESDLDSGERARRQGPALQLEIQPVSREQKDFLWLVGMAYRDEGVLYITTRVVVERQMIVAYRAAVTDSHMGVEEIRPIHVADVESLLRYYLIVNNPVMNRWQWPHIHREQW